ncbi:MAG: S-methyl-5'-thioadenosine phosphorylase [Candidatus Omnitrophica bacterium]|nr:S-methyl-5'-thioadenosine phosphorylase [Candidatus Omnitrophota bacterium]
MAKIGVIGGSGLYEIEGLKDQKWVKVATPFGETSDDCLIGKLERHEIIFLPRHGRGHRISPSDINYRANIYAMKKLGVDRIISVTACGSLKADIVPMDFVVVDQFVDRTNQARKMTFFDRGIVAHISFAHPVCKELSGTIYEVGYGISKDLNLKVHKGCTYLNMEGPAFSTLAESNLYRSWGMDIIGMTNMAEAKLAREAEICYSTLAAVTDFDCWHPDHETITIEMVLRNLRRNIENAKQILVKVIKKLPEERTCECQNALRHAIITDGKLVPAKVKEDLRIIIGKYIKE